MVSPTPPLDKRELVQKLRTYVGMLAQLRNAIKMAVAGSDEATFLQAQIDQVQATITDIRAQLAAD